MAIFCMTQFAALEPVTIEDLTSESIETAENEEALLYRNTVKLLAWVSRRYYEIIIFRILQDASNRLESFSADERSEIAKALSDILSLGTMEICKAEDSFMVCMDIIC